MQPVLKHKFDVTGALLTCSDRLQCIPVMDWFSNEISLSDGTSAETGTVNLLLEQEKAIECDGGLGLIIPHSVLAELEAWQIKGLGFPRQAPFRLVINTHGTLASPAFTIDYGFTYYDTLPVSINCKVGAFIDCGKNQYILPDPMYSIVQMIEEYKNNPIVDLDERFLWWSKIQDLFSEDVGIGNFLRNINIVRPEQFTLDFAEHNGAIEIIPRFVIAPQRVELQTINEELNETKDLIAPAVQNDFQHHFLRQQTTKARYALSNNWFVIIPPILKKALQVVRELKDAPTEKKLEFLINPRAELRRQLENDLDEKILEALFVESPLFLSARIKTLGVWEPKAGLFIKTETGEWLPGESAKIVLPLKDGVYSIASEDLPALVCELEQAFEKGEKELKFNGQKFQVSIRNIEAIKKAARIFAPPEHPQITKNGEGKDGKEPILRPIIYDHISELGIAVDAKGSRSRVWEGEAGLNAAVILHAHQKDGLEWLKEHWRKACSGALLADDMGLGKTIQTLAFMKWVSRQMDHGCTQRRPFLVVAPTGLLNNWEAEANKFLDPPGLGGLLKAHGAHFNSLVNSGFSGVSAEIKDAGWVLTTYETLRDKIKAFTGVHFAVVVFDEAQKIKNPKAMVTDMAKAVKAEFTLALTGTPVENSMADLWCIIDTVKPGHFDTLKVFANNYMPNGRVEKELLGGLKSQLMESTPSLMLRRTKDEHWKERPEKIEKSYEVEMPKIQADAYSSVVAKAQAFAGTKGAMLEALQMLRSVSLHPCLYEDINNCNDYIASSARLITTFKILDDICESGRKALIFVEFLRMQSILSELISRKYGCQSIMIINGDVSGPKRQKKVDEFQAGSREFDVMILSPKAGGVGINLTAATHVIHLSRWWNPAVEDQCSDRAYRIGQTHPVTIHYPLAFHPVFGREHSFDIKLKELLERKRYLSRTLLAPPVASENEIENLFKYTVKQEVDSSLVWEQHRWSIDDIDIMEPLEFENWVLDRMAENGYTVRSTPRTGDAGADGICIAPAGSEKPNIILQCKHTQRDGNLGISAFEEVWQARNRFELPSPIQLWVVTNGYFSTRAIERARELMIHVVDRESILGSWVN